MKRVLIAGALLLLTGCVSYGEKLQSWQNQPVASLVSSWGPPQSFYELPDGGQVIQYSRSGNMVLPGATYTTPQTTYHNGTASAYGSGGYANANYNGTSTTYVQHQNPDIDIALSCVTQFTVSPSGYIVSYTWRGNNC
jgi:starvation-inducible outer membrane lipoprotein